MALYRKLDSGRVARTFDPTKARDPNTGMVLNQDETNDRVMSQEQLSGAWDKYRQAENRLASVGETEGLDAATAQKFSDIERQKMQESFATGEAADVRQARDRMPPQQATAEQPLKTIGETPVPSQSSLAERRKELTIKQASGEKLSKEDLGDLYDMTQIDKAVSPFGVSDPTMGGAMPGEGLPQVTPEEYLNFTPQQRAAYDQMAYQQKVAQQQGMLGDYQSQQDQIIADRIARQQGQIEELQGGLDPLSQRRLDLMQESVDAQKGDAISSVREAGLEQQASLQNLAARRGFNRSSATATALQKASDAVVKQVSQIEQAAQRQLADYEIKLLDKQDQKIAELESKLESSYDAQDQLDLEQLKAQQELTTSLMSQNPMNPENIQEAAVKLQAQRIEEAKLAQKEAESLRNMAAQNFELMLNNFGSSFLQGMGPEEKAIYATNLGLAPGMLDKIGATQQELDREWEQLQYVTDKEFQLQLLDKNFQNDIYKKQLDHGLESEIMKLEQEYNIDLDNLRREAGLPTNGGEGAVGEAVSSEYVLASSEMTDQSAYYDEPIVHPQAGVDVVQANLKVQKKYPQGYKFNAGPNSLIGECKWFSQQITTLENGAGWTIGSTAAQTSKNLTAMVNKGTAFRVGQEPIKIGQTLITNDSATFWHSATVTGKTPDGKLVLTEANMKPKTVTHSRIMSPDDPRIQGVVKTKLKPEYQFSADEIEKANKVKKTKAYKDLDKHQQVIKNALFSERKGLAGEQVDAFNQAMEAGKVDQAKSIVSTALQKNMDADSKKRLVAAQNTLNNYKSIENALDKLESDGKTTGWYDPGTMLNKPLNAISMGDQDRRKAEQLIISSIQSYRQQMSGAAFTPEEAAEYASLFPSMDKSMAENMTDLQALKIRLNNERDAVYNIASSGLYPTYNDFLYSFEERPQAATTQYYNQAASGLRSGLDKINASIMRANYSLNNPTTPNTAQELDQI